MASVLQRHYSYRATNVIPLTRYAASLLWERFQGREEVGDMPQSGAAAEEEPLTAHEVAERLGVRAQTVYTWAKKGGRLEKAVVRKGREVRFRPDALPDSARRREGYGPAFDMMLDRYIDERVKEVLTPVYEALQKVLRDAG